MAEFAPRVAIVTVLYRSQPFVHTLLSSIAAVDYPNDRLEIHLVDNGPGDGSLAQARDGIARLAGRLPQVLIHEPGENTGFAIGNNIALRAALSRGVDYCFLLNPDAFLEPGAVKEAVNVARRDARIGSVQSLLLTEGVVDEINSRGNRIHYLGFGYVGGYRELRGSVPDEVVDIAFASGACALLPARVLQQVGLLDETLWLYQEDMDLGWRLRLLGYRNVLAPRSLCQHRYEFSRTKAKWYFLERNRWLVVLKNYRLPTIVLLLPQLVLSDLAVLALAVKGGWSREKLRAMAYLLRPATWSYIARKRRQLSRQRRVPDCEILRHFTAVIAHPDFQTPLITKLAEPVWKVSFAVLKAIVRW